jgi:glutamyl-tRNA synthetase
MWDKKPAAWRELAITATQKGKSLTDMAEALRFAFERPTDFDDKAVAKFMTPAVKPALREVAAIKDYGHHSPGLANRTGREADGPKGGAQEEHRHEALEAAFTAILEKHGLKTKDLAQALRVALCGRPVSPGIYDTLMLVGRDEVVARLQRWLESS